MKKFISLFFVLLMTLAGCSSLTNVAAGAAGVGMGLVIYPAWVISDLTSSHSSDVISRYGIAINKNGRIVVSMQTGFLTSTDSKKWSWTEKTSTAGIVNAIAVNSSGIFAAVVDWGTVETSANGRIWRVAHPAGESLYGITADDDQLMAVGEAGTIITSMNGKTWKKVNSGTGASLLGIVVDNNGKFVVVGRNGTIITSDDGGKIWAAATSNTTERLLGVTVNSNGIFAAVGNNGTIVTSNDGKNWTKARSRTRGDLYSIAANSSGRFVAVGKGGTIVTSNDNGVSWRVVETDAITDSDQISAIAVDRYGMFMAAGWREDGSYIYTSSDGITWTKIKV